ncbi:MAG: 3-deoxy-8-phosphooctulonate synthase [Desulfovibrionaceae bacterium]|nr:3-deoxy-8-phosphooctulonate synthase [Desulfovibrionaceae bacterium]
MFAVGNACPLFFIAGPCAIESRSHAMEVSSALKEIFADADIPFIYKSSFDKANRSSGTGFRGPGIKDGLEILAEVRESRQIPVLTDIHTADQAAPAAQAVDYLQTPAFLCRQTDLIQAAAAAGKPVNIKKGQFLAPWEMENVLKKALATGNDKISLCERGTSFGYGNLVVDMRGLEIMKRFAPVIFDATHSVQLPGSRGSCSGGQREFVAALARAASAIGVAGIFMEVHPDPDKAPCDGPNMLAIRDLPNLLRQLKKIDRIAKTL